MSSLFHTDNKYVQLLGGVNPRVQEMIDQAKANIWLDTAITYTRDSGDWTKLNSDQQYYLKRVLFFFAASDGIVNENIVLNFIKNIQMPEVNGFYAIQVFMEYIHSVTYSKLIQTYITDPTEREYGLKAIETDPIIAKKAAWCFKWMDEKNDFFQRMTAFLAVEGIFFAGSFAAIFWLRDQGFLKHSLGQANEYISKDEALHADFACMLLNDFAGADKPNEAKTKEIILSALYIEKEFVIDALPVRLAGMNSELMTQYLEFITDSWFVKLGYTKEFNVENPFPFMASLGQDRKDNFFENKGANYGETTKEESLMELDLGF